jgi:hypothetical protein
LKRNKIRLSFFVFSFSHCIVCPSSNYGVWLPLWYLQTFIYDFIVFIVEFYFASMFTPFSFFTSLGHLRLNLKGMIENKKNRMSNKKPTWKIWFLLIIFGTYTAKSSLHVPFCLIFKNIFEPRTLRTIDPSPWNTVRIIQAINYKYKLKQRYQLRVSTRQFKCILINCETL